MDLIDKYFELVGPRIDIGVMRYMGFDQETQTQVENRLAKMLGLEGIDNIMKEMCSGIIEHQSGGYDLRFKITNWDIHRDDFNVDTDFYIDNIDVRIDPKSTLEFIGGNGAEYELGDLYNYSDIDELNAKYNTEDNPITEDDIHEIGYEIQDAIKDWLYFNVYPVTGVGFEDVHTSNAHPSDLTEQIVGLDIKKFALYADIFEPLHKAFESGNLETGYRELSKKIHGDKQYILDYFYNFIKQNEDYLMSKMNVVESLIRINVLMTDKPNKK